MSVGRAPLEVSWTAVALCWGSTGAICASRLSPQEVRLVPVENLMVPRSGSDATSLYRRPSIAWCAALKTGA